MPRSRMTAAERRLRARIDRLEPALRRQVLHALMALRARVSIAHLERVIRQGDIALHSLLSSLPTDLQPAVILVQSAVATSMTATASAYAPALTLTNPWATEAARAAGARLVTSVTGDARSAIRQLVTRSFQEGIAPRELARMIQPLIGLTERQARAVLARRAVLIARGWAVARVSSAVVSYANRLLRQRATMIARTELIRASVDGQLAIWRQMQAEGLLSPNARKRWMVTPDDRLCPICEELDGETAPISGTFTVPKLPAVAGPPAHPQCRCALVIALPASVRQRAA